MPGIKVGHHTLAERPTGCTVVLAEAGATAAVDVRGAAPATRETDLLDPVNLVQVAHAIVLSGGSAFGLDSASRRDAVSRREEDRLRVRPRARADRAGGGAVRSAGRRRHDPAVRRLRLPGGDGGDRRRRSPKAASAPAPARRSAKLSGAARAMKGGIGSASIDAAGRLIVAALVAVNAFGDVIDPATGTVVAGVRGADGTHASPTRGRCCAPARCASAAPAQNTTLGVVATNARLTKTEAKRVAQMAHDGFARAIAPAHTPVDGDTIFVLATGARAGTGRRRPASARSPPT